MSAGTVHAIHGYLGAGKTTFARRLEADTGGVRLSIDEWTIGLSGDRTLLPPDLFERVWRLLSELWPRIAAAGSDVILDFGFWSRASRDEVRSRAASVGAKLVMYELQCSDQVAIDRCLARRDDDAYNIDEGAFEYLRQKFEPLDSDEHAHLVVTE